MTINGFRVASSTKLASFERLSWLMKFCWLPRAQNDDAQNELNLASVSALSAACSPMVLEPALQIQPSEKGRCNKHLHKISMGGQRPFGNSQGPL